RTLQRMDTAIQIRHCHRSASRRIEREPAGKTKRVQHPAAVRQGFHQTPVFALVQKKACLLPTQHIGLEAQAGFQENHRLVEVRPMKDLSVRKLELAPSHRLNITAE